MTTAERAELLKLLAALCDGRATDAQQERLEAMLSASGAARQLYLQYVDVHARLVMHPGLAKSRKMPPKEAWTWAALDEAAGMERRAAAWHAFRRRYWTWQRAAAYAGVAAATLAATLLIQITLRGPQGGNISELPAAGQPEPPQYVATLAQTANARWEPQVGLADGTRLLPGEIKLAAGLARIHFDSGIDLLLEGPAALRLESSKAAWLHSGKVVFRGEAAAAPFAIRTPTSIFVDIGTEYGLEVGQQRDELHVFTGEVQRTAIDAAATGPRGTGQPEAVTAGQARWYTKISRSAGQETKNAPDYFVHDMPRAVPAGVDPLAGLLAYEGFAYANATDLKDRLGLGGLGWQGPWEFGVMRQLPRGKQPQVWSLNVGESLLRPDAPAASAGGSFDYTGLVKYQRRLATPVRLDTDGVYYLSYLFRREGPSRDRENLVGVQFRQDDELKRERRGSPDFRQRLNVGVSRCNELFMNLQRHGDRVPLPLSYQESYLLVAKIVASGERPDQFFVRVYGLEEAVDPAEPESWQIVGPPVESNLTFDWLEIEINSWRRQTLDEVRLGSTWSAVTAPYLVSPDR